MLCQNCQKNEATTHIKRVINGETTEKHLCQSCAKKLGYDYDGFFDDFSFSIPNIFSGFFSDAPRALAGLRADRCETCGSSFDDIIRTGMVGCADCYERFYDRLLPSIQRIHGRAKHAGRIPFTVTAETEAQPKAQEAVAEPTTEEKIRRLQADMQKAIDCQNFEQAAVLRDNIKALRGEN
ncbi:MAG: UvrB/UvrC motif-containing protein [Clostridia bacterium]|nr:UvrB/UvrC motif-containing protein [Clostridia bacterium]MBR3553498.1 UvrB/UvrC motif-containing protein [Clostridia bacterium]